MTRSNIQQQESNPNQYGAVNNNLLNGNEVETTIEVVGLHLYTAGSVIMLILITCAVILLWRCCKRKNRQKIARFICIKWCRYTEDPSETPERSVTYAKATGARVEDVPLNANRLVALANQLTLNQAFS